MSEIILQLQHLFAGYGNKPVLKNIDFTLQKGELLGIVGESGSGKSTLLRAVRPLARQGVINSKGKVFYKGKDMDSYTLKEKQGIAGAGIGMIFQNPMSSFNPVRSFEKQFKEALKSHGIWEGSRSLDKAEDLLCQMNLQEGITLLKRRPFELSGGMNQRLSILLSVLLEPELLLCDEPTGALDVTTQTLVMDTLTQLCKKKKISLIIVTHNLGIAAKICDNTAVLYGGEIIEYGKTSRVMTRPDTEYTNNLLKAVPRLKR